MNSQTTNLSFMSIVREASKLFLENFSSFFMLMSLWFMPFYFQSVGIDFENFNIQEAVNHLNSGAFMLDILLLVVFTLMWVAGFSAVIYFTNTAIKGRPVGLMSALKGGVSCGCSMIWTWLMLCVFTAALLIVFFMWINLFQSASWSMAVGLAATFLLMVVFGVFWMFVFQAVVTQGHSGISALKYSYHLVSGRWWQVFFYALIVVVALTVLMAAIAFILDSLLGSGSFAFRFFVTFVESMLFVVSTVFTTCFFARLVQSCSEES